VPLRRLVPPTIDPILPVEGLEEILGITDRFRPPEKQDSPIPEGEVEETEYVVVDASVEVNEEVSA
jgi:hypothetical protein